ncbi:NAD(P)-dependent oxidoreductase [Dysgonomonas sp. 520]|uniref:NAD(P)-dependent oxidoreductase n=1 Tax=Dysgonomonas sp. 520 TaxID=2302931 RepID=UPI0013D0110F|nr:NAD(P)H-binding protein [Dysgonomonas sp. 520]NDW09090.1 NAD-dependent epimerase/dehydratase family protein [Dysgonomonas sp. 520]
MKIALIGATGFVGSALLKEFALRNYQVTAIARDTSKITEKAKLVNIDVANDEKKLAEALKGSDVVVSAFNAGWANPNLYEDNMKGFATIDKAVKDAGVKRMIVIGGAGSLYIDGKQIVDGDDFPEEIKPGALSVKDYLNKLKDEKEIDWEFFSPAINMHAGIKTGRTGKYRLGTTSPVFGKDGESTLSVEDLAVAIADEVENHKFSRQQFTAGY